MTPDIGIGLPFKIFSRLPKFLSILSLDLSVIIAFALLKKGKVQKYPLGGVGEKRVEGDSFW